MSCLQVSRYVSDFCSLIRVLSALSVWMVSSLGCSLVSSVEVVSAMVSSLDGSECPPKESFLKITSFNEKDR